MLYPMFALVLLTVIIGSITVKTRFASVRNGELNRKYFILMQGYEVPENITITTRCFNNMFELPMLFYVVATLYMVLGLESLTGLILAWLFVALRCLHTYIHLTYNNVFHRMKVYWAGLFCMLLMWLNLIILAS